MIIVIIFISVYNKSKIITINTNGRATLRSSIPVSRVAIYNPSVYPQELER